MKLLESVDQSITKFSNFINFNVHCMYWLKSVIPANSLNSFQGRRREIIMSEVQMFDYRCIIVISKAKSVFYNWPLPSLGWCSNISSYFAVNLQIANLKCLMQCLFNLFLNFHFNFQGSFDKCESGGNLEFYLLWSFSLC